MVHGREAVLADAQEPVAGDRHLDDDPRRSLYAPSELVPYKPRADVILVGSAYAPDAQPVDALVARLTLGELDKAIGVIGDRVWIDGPDGLEPSPPRPFRSMPLAYERSSRAPENPNGFDLARAPVLGAPALPNLEAADDEIGGDRTVGFGPVSREASARRALLQAGGRAFVEGGERGPVPPGFDFAYYNAAPRDQQIDVVRPGTALVLVNLNREHARLETKLPAVRPKAFLVPADVERGIEIALRCDTVWVDTDRALLTLSWRGILSVETPDEDALGTLVVAAQGRSREVGYAQIARLLRDGVTSTTDGETYAETGRIRPEGRLPPLPASAPLPISPVAPVVNTPEDTVPPVSWEELTGSDVFETTATDEPKTVQQQVQVRHVIEDPFTEEPSTRQVQRAVPLAPPPELEAADYARIAVASERGEAARVLFRYGLTMPDMPRLQRAWTERAATDPAFADAFSAAVQAARAVR
jgi:hypothetical protein